MAESAIPVVVVAATPIFREGVSAIVAHAPELRLAAVLGPREVRTRLPAGRGAPTVVIEGLLHPLEELDLLQECLHTRQPGTWLVVFSHSYLPTAAWAWQQGVRGLVKGDTTEKTIQSAIQAVADHHDHTDPAFRKLHDQSIERLANGSVWALLTQMERKVLRLAAYEALSNAEIGEQLGVSPGTVKTHLTNLRRALPQGLGNGATGADVLSRAADLRERSERILLGAIPTGGGGVGDSEGKNYYPS